MVVVLRCLWDSWHWIATMQLAMHLNFKDLCPLLMTETFYKRSPHPLTYDLLSTPIAIRQGNLLTKLYVCVGSSNYRRQYWVGREPLKILGWGSQRKSLSLQETLSCIIVNRNMIWEHCPEVVIFHKWNFLYRLIKWKYPRMMPSNLCYVTPSVEFSESTPPSPVFKTGRRTPQF